MSSSLPAWADNTISDGDGMTPLADQNLVLGDVCQGETEERTVLVGVNRVGGSNNNTFKNSSTVTVSVLATSGAGLNAAMGSPNTITLPTNWQSLANNSKSSSVASTVTFTAGTLGAFSGSVTYRGSGINVNNRSLNRDDVMNVTANVIECVPPDTERRS